ncbi:MAG: c-type cytochrome [Anaerolineae bacterium]|nr:c-type cytochrome [Anaerolineae bacterium]
MLSLRQVWIIPVALVLCLGFSFSVQAGPPAQGDAGRGKYLMNAAGCWGCHGQNLAGYQDGRAASQPDSAPYGQAFQGPFGVITAKNLTSDPETGLGAWSDSDIEQALRAGKSKSGRQLHPIMPYPNFAGMSEQDMKDLIAYLRTAPAVKNAVPATRLTSAAPPAPPGRGFPASAPTSGVARGEYLVVNVAGCGDCHTPSDAQGAPDRTKWLAGNAVPGETGFQIAPNITPSQKTGIGGWTEAQIAQLLRTGERPGRSPVVGLMAEVIGIGHPAFQGFGFSQLNDLDRLAIAQYLKSIPAVENVPQPPAAPAPAQPQPQATTAATAVPTTAPTTAPTAAATTTGSGAPTAAPTAAATATAITPSRPPSAGAGGAAPPETLPVTGSLPVQLAELVGGLGALVSFLMIAWRRARM